MEDLLEGSDDEGDNNDDELDSTQFSQAAGPKTTGECGVIEKVEIENFMCHENLSVKLCPRINYITGINGSGKSAVLAAIQVCLGAKSGKTHRAKKNSDFIRHGHDGSCTIRVTLRNQGTDAYRPEVFGKSVTVQRTIQQNGATTYKLLTARGKAMEKKDAVKTARKELQDMLDKFNLDVNNPVTVLDQENAKHFLHGKTKRSKSVV